jgi:ribosomal protein S18 acetylase RimI-like enzyme
MTSSPSNLRMGASFERAISLYDGRNVRLRWIGPADASLLRDGFERLSMQSRLMRFFSPLHTLSDDSVQYLTQVDGIDHAALIAVAPRPSTPTLRDERAWPREQGFGVARFIRSVEDSRSAEVALTVTDDTQGRGLGRRLTQALAVAAGERGVETFTMSVLWSNARIQAFLRRLGATRRRTEGEVVEYTIPTASVANQLTAARPAD